MSTTKETVLNIILHANMTGAGIRTTEIEFRTGKANPELTPEEISDAVAMLLRDKEIKCVTEEWKDYCWLVPFHWNNYTVGPVVKHDCEIFGLWPAPDPAILRGE